MYIGNGTLVMSLFLIAVGAILAWAVTATVTGIDIQDSGDGRQQRGLSSPRFSDEEQQLAEIHVEVDALEHRDGGLAGPERLDESSDLHGDGLLGSVAFHCAAL